MCKWRWDAGVQLQFTQGLDCKHSKCQGSKRKWPLNIKTAPSVDALFIFFNGRPPPPLHLQLMVGRNGLFSGYKSQRTKGHKGDWEGGETEKKLGKLREEETQNRREKKEIRRATENGRNHRGGKRQKKSHEQGEKRRPRTKTERGDFSRLKTVTQGSIISN